MDLRDQKFYKVEENPAEFNVRPFPNNSCSIYETSEDERFVSIVDSIESLSLEILLDYDPDLKNPLPARKRLDKIIISREISSDYCLDGFTICGLAIKECLKGVS